MQHFLSDQTIQRYLGCFAVLFQGSFDSIHCDAGGRLGRSLGQKWRGEGGVVRKNAKPWSTWQPRGYEGLHVALLHRKISYTVKQKD